MSQITEGNYKKDDLHDENLRLVMKLFDIGMDHIR